MGTSKRYAEQVDRRMGERADEAAIRGLAARSLTDAGLELDTLALNKTPRPHEVRAWVRRGGGDSDSTSDRVDPSCGRP